MHEYLQSRTVSALIIRNYYHCLIVILTHFPTELNIKNQIDTCNVNVYVSIVQKARTIKFVDYIINLQNKNWIRFHRSARKTNIFTAEI